MSSESSEWKQYFVYAIISMVIAWLNVKPLNDILYISWLPTLAIIIVVNVGIVAVIALLLRVVPLGGDEKSFENTYTALKGLSLEQGLYLVIAAGAVITGDGVQGGWVQFACNSALIYTLIAVVLNQVDIRNAVVDLIPGPAN